MRLQYFQVHNYVIFGIRLLFLAGICFGTHSSSFSSEGVRSNLNVEANNPSVEPSNCLQTHITQSYFEKHASLLDSDFQDFIALEVAIWSCEVWQDKLNYVPKVSTVWDRHLIGEGSHRHLSSSIRFEIPPESISAELPAHTCEAIIIERLPSGVFADPFELQHLIHRGLFNDAAVFGDTNLELPSFRSNRSIVEVHMDMGPNIFSGRQSEAEISIQLPLHARYPPLGERGFSAVGFGPPDLFLRCSIEGKSSNESCLVASSERGNESQPKAIVWEVPCGIKEHAGAVYVGTFMQATVSALLIVATAILYSDEIEYNHMKQS